MATAKKTPTTIKFEFEGKEYTLGFNRATVRNMEARGFSVEKAGEAPLTYLPMLFHGAFLMKHPTVTQKTTDRIYASLGDKDELFTVLMTAYGEPMEFLFAEPEDAKKVAWTVVK